jgi:hypothetical protein
VARCLDRATAVAQPLHNFLYDDLGMLHVSSRKVVHVFVNNRLTTHWYSAHCIYSECAPPVALQSLLLEKVLHPRALVSYYLSRTVLKLSSIPLIK